MNRTFEIVGLDCANCAAKMERSVEKIEGIDSVSIDFMTKKMILKAATIDEPLLEEINKAIRKIEDHVTLKDVGEVTDTKINHIIIKIILGSVFASIGLWVPVPDIFSWMFIIIGYLIIGGDVLHKAGKNIFKGNVFDEMFLMSIATIGAFLIDEAFEAIIVMLFFQIGEAFQTYAVGKSRGSISSLMDMKPEFALVQRNGQVLRVSPEEVVIDETIVVRPGDKVPLDGIVIDGVGAIDARALTGESLPVDIGIGSEVLSGCINLNSLLAIKVKKTYEDSTVAKILDLVEHASSKKSKSEKFITSFAKYYTPIVVVAAMILAVVPPLIGWNEWYPSIYSALSFLVVSCPCALVISIPLGFFGGIGGAAKHGILVKGSNYLEVLSKADVILFDKTGTLTKGTFQIKELHPTTVTKDELLETAAIAERFSNHPIAVSIAKAIEDAVDPNEISQVEELAGHGVSLIHKGKKIYVGNDKLMEKIQINYEKCNSIGSVVHVVRDREYLGYILVADEVKADAREAVQGLKQLGIQKVAMVTGDQQATAEAIGNTLGVDKVYAQLLPGGKVEVAEQELGQVREKRKVAYVGDGINDAPVLARADVGIAMGGLGSQAAIEAADIVIMNDAPSKIVTAIKISKKTMTIVKQNIALAFIVKGLVLFLATGGMSTLLEAIFADVGVAVLAILNAMRAMNYKE